MRADHYRRGFQVSPSAASLFIWAVQMTRDQFRQQFLAATDDQMLGVCLRNQDVPFVFEQRPQSWQDFRLQVSQELNIETADLCVVGSGRLGFSLKPGNNLKAYSDRSDIDVLIVNHKLFDDLWQALVAAIYPRYPASYRLGGWLEARRKEIYTGWITPLEIRLDGSIYGAKAKHVNDFRLRWFTTLKRASQHPPRRHSDVKARLYRNWRFADLYHLNGLAELHQSLQA